MDFLYRKITANVRDLKYIKEYEYKLNAKIRTDKGQKNGLRTT